ncbi:MAG: citrate transporter [Clostridiales bacterium]|nr:citrate transporter [Clostridiales bacterium]
MEIAIGIILLVTFFAFIYYAAKGGNLLLGLFGMAILWSGLGAIGKAVDWETINMTIFQGGPEGFGPTAVNIIFGSWFGRILIETGIARTIIRRAVELGGDKPALTTILLSIVVTAIFTTAYGVGAVVAIGVIVFPIMLSLGISKPLATGTFAMSVGSGLYVNSALLTQAAGTMVIGEEQFNPLVPEWYRFAGIAVAIQVVAVILMVTLSVRKENKVKAWAVPTVDAGIDPEQSNANLLACITPILPVTFAIAFKFSAIVAIIVSVVWALFWTKNIKSWKGVATIVEKTFHDGVADVGLVLGFLLFLQMFIRSAGACKDLLAPIVSPIFPTNTLWLFVVFGLLSVLALFRGPMTIWGAGVATFVIIASTGLYPLAVLYPLFYIPATTITTSVCPTQSWNLWAIGYNKVGVKEFLTQVLAYILPVALILEIIAYFMFAA